MQTDCPLTRSSGPERAPDGVHIAYITEIGTQQFENKYKKKESDPSHILKVFIKYDFIGEDDRTYTAREYFFSSISNSPKNRLVARIRALKPSAFTEELIEKSDLPSLWASIQSLVGLEVSVTITHKEGSNYADVSAVSLIPQRRRPQSAAQSVRPVAPPAPLVDDDIPF